MQQRQQTLQEPSKNKLLVQHSFIAGGVAGVLAESFLHPFDTISLRIKIQNGHSPKYTSFSHACSVMMKEEGFRGFFGGLGTTLLFAPVCTALYFGAYEGAKAMLAPHFSEKNQNIVYFTAGAASELACSFFSVPMEVIKSNLQLGKNPNNASGGWLKHTHNYRNTLHAYNSILGRDGIRGLYAGYSSCIAVDMLFSAFSFLFFEQLKLTYSNNIYKFPWVKQSKTESNFVRTSINNRNHNTDEYEFSPVELIVLGSAAGGGAALLTNPLDVVTVRLMTQGRQKGYTGIMQCLKKTVQTEGNYGLWRGSIARILNVMPCTGITFAVYETIKRSFYHDSSLLDFDQLDD